MIHHILRQLVIAAKLRSEKLLEIITIAIAIRTQKKLNIDGAGFIPNKYTRVLRQIPKDVKYKSFMVPLHVLALELLRISK